MNMRCNKPAFNLHPEVMQAIHKIYLRLRKVFRGPIGILSLTLGVVTDAFLRHYKDVGNPNRLISYVGGESFLPQNLYTLNSVYDEFCYTVFSGSKRGTL